jgi:hypothetical protein
MLTTINVKIPPLVPMVCLRFNFIAKENFLNISLNSDLVKIIEKQNNFIQKFNFHILPVKITRNAVIGQLDTSSEERF